MPRATNPVIVVDSDSENDDLQIIGGTPVVSRTPYNAINDDDDLQITNVVELVPTEPARPRVMLHTPSGEMLIPAINNSRPESRSFENQQPLRANRPPAIVPRYNLLDRRRREQQERNRVTEAYQTGIERARRQSEEERNIRMRERRQREIWRDNQRQQMRYVEGHRPVGFYEDDDYDEEEDEDYDPEEEQFLEDLRNEDRDFSAGQNPLRAFGFPFFVPRPNILNHNVFHNNNDGIPEHIMRIIEEREAAAFHDHQQLHLKETGKHSNILKDQAKDIKNPYTVTIDPGEDYVCPLCGVVLGVGIEDNFKTDTSPLEQLQEKNDVQAPYQASNLITDTDKDLSKRMFIARCGHMYCGRCVKSITSIKSMLKQNKKKIKKNENSISNPYIYAPLSCVADNCKSKFNVKTPFNEVFL